MSDEELVKALGPLSELTFGIGTMIGAGIFVLRGVAARAAVRSSWSLFSPASP